MASAQSIRPEKGQRPSLVVGSDRAWSAPANTGTSRPVISAGGNGGLSMESSSCCGSCDAFPAPESWLRKSVISMSRSSGGPKSRSLSIIVCFERFSTSFCRFVTSRCFFLSSCTQPKNTTNQMVRNTDFLLQLISKGTSGVHHVEVLTVLSWVA